MSNVNEVAIALIEGNLISMKCQDLDPILFSSMIIWFLLIIDIISRRMMYSNLLYSLGSEWTSIAHLVENIIHSIVY